MPRTDQAFWDLRESPLKFTPEQWDAYYPCMAQWLQHDNAEIRTCTIERLCTAVFWAEHSGVRSSDRSQQAQLSRLAWLIACVQSAQRMHADVVNLFLGQLRYTSDVQPVAQALLNWFDALCAQPPHGVDIALVQGLRVLHETPDEKWSVRAAHWLALLDDPLDHVRSCAAYRLGRDYDEDNSDPTDEEVMRVVSAKEIERPGVAGPLWAERHVGDWPPYINLWMLDLLERRKSTAPKNALFNDIDFYLHELCSHSPEQVRRMVRGGFFELALMTATEHDQPVPGMESVLRELATCTHERVARAAALRLARLAKAL